ncbi:PaaI family thioesterase [Sinimarinibacterium thermocellulolyticum]|uniref:PaaI family thioesterase n=1 Tax=Sinimarinibacterium thermocellulolyticum TaxID=3170016 RepID=A0ABV2A7U2_9GAMM
MTDVRPGPPMRIPGADAEAAWQILLARIPYARHLGLEVRRHDSGRELHLPYREPLIGNILLPALHGGVLGALVEITARVAAQSADADGRRPQLLNCDIDYLRSARAQSTFARAEMIRLGRRSGLVRVICRQDDPRRPIAVGRVQLLFPGAAGPTRGPR